VIILGFFITCKINKKRAIFKRIQNNKGGFVDNDTNNRTKTNKERRKEEKEERETLKIFPVVQLTWSRLPRIVVIDWKNIRSREYRLDHLTNGELNAFWHMDANAKIDYLIRCFNRHHRRPRCQKGVTECHNLSYVDIESHTSYNKLIFVISRWFKMSEAEVKTKHIAIFLKKVYPSLERLMTNPVTRKMKSLKSLLHTGSFNKLSPAFIGNVAKWAGIKFGAVHANDIRRFITQIYLALKRIAYDHSLGRLKTLPAFIKVLNKIWIPRDCQIILKL